MTVKDWYSKPAYWWQFWLPQSGFVGGIVAGVIVTTIALNL